jgi:hypothetical protein
MLFALSGVVVSPMIVAATRLLDLVWHVIFSMASIAGKGSREIGRCRLQLMRLRPRFSGELRRRRHGHEHHDPERCDRRGRSDWRRKSPG